MKKYILVIMLSIVSLVSFNITQAQTATNANDACKNKKNGDACSYSTSGRGAQAGSTTSGFCDRTNGDSNAANNPLTCRSGDGWKDCVIVGDACLGNTSTPGQRGTSTTTGTCAMRTTPASGRSAARTEMICDTSVKPPGNPGGSTPETCGGVPCPSPKVCAKINNEDKCVEPGVSNNNQCGGVPCPSPPKVCAKINNEDKCVDDASKPGAPADNGTTPDANSPQTVGFINPSRFNSITELIAGIINALLGILGAITVAVLVASGFKYMTSSNPGEVGQALEGIRNAIVGLMIIMGSFLITQYVISALAV
jgi:hypothetical protein